jgi:sphinganine-1-phosphate aldolase
MPLPAHGMPAEAVLDQLSSLKAGDRDWRSGRVFSLVYSAGDEVHHLLEQASLLYLSENALNTEVFPSLRRMQADILSITGDLLGGDDSTAGFMTSGGTESILMAVKAAREWGKAERGIDEPSMVLATSAHAAFAKASHYFGVRSVRVPVGPDYRADVDAMTAAIDATTVLVVASAPSYPQGVVDPVPELAALAQERGILCHVDACMGGFLLPFLERLGRFEKPWDFRVPGVTSMSADLHKYGYAAKGASTVMYRSRDLRRHQAFLFDGWLGGAYGSPAMAGTKPAGPIAAAWAVLHHLGEDGYLRLTEAASDAARELLDGLRSMPELAVRGEPEATLVAFGAADPEALDVFAVADVLARSGWFLDRQTPPDSLHGTVHAGHAGVIPDVLADLGAAVAEVGAGRAEDRATTYGTVE